jgi:DNA modification methylase
MGNQQLVIFLQTRNYGLTIVKMTWGNAEKMASTLEERNTQTDLNGGGHVHTENYYIDHPAMFPEALARDHILSWSNPGDTVLDPFLGSGTTLKMAVLYDRHGIGIELEPEYMAIAEKRIHDAQQQMRLPLDV